PHLFPTLLRPQPLPPLFPYTTLFRSQAAARKKISPPGYFLLFVTPAERNSSCASFSRSGTASPCTGTFVVAIAESAATPVCLNSDRKSTRLNSSHVSISYAVFCLKKK